MNIFNFLFGIKEENNAPFYSIFSVLGESDDFGNSVFLGHVKVENNSEYLGDSPARALKLAKKILGERAVYVALDLMATNFPGTRKLLN